MGNWTEKEKRARDLARFWKHTKPEGNCLIWTGQRNRDGYGKFTTTTYPKTQKHHVAHRWFYQRVFGLLPAEIVLLHSCDNPACVKLQHLDPGTRAKNNADMHAKGRARGLFPEGSNHPSAKLTEDQVREIKKRLAAGETQRSIASLFGLTREAVRDINTGKNWSHVK